jgi:hypothetical protein
VDHRASRLSPTTNAAAPKTITQWSQSQHNNKQPQHSRGCLFSERSTSDNFPTVGRNRLRKLATGQTIASDEEQHEPACFCRGYHLCRVSLDAHAQRLAAIARTRSLGCKQFRTRVRGNDDRRRQYRQLTSCCLGHNTRFDRRIHYSGAEATVDRIIISNRRRLRARAAGLDLRRSAALSRGVTR